MPDVLPCLSKLARWLGVIVCQWMLSVLMLAIMVLSLWNCVDYWRTAVWIQVDGTIISVEISNYDESEPASDWSGRGKLSCQYGYTFDGQDHLGERIGVETFGGRATRARRHKLLKAQFDQAKSIPVLVNPAAPTESALFRETLSEMYFGPAIGLTWFAMLFFGRRRIPMKDKSPK